MVNTTIEVIDLLNRLKGYLSSVPDPGLILIHESFVQSDEQFYDLFVGHKESDDGHGILISYVGFTQREESAFAVNVKHKFAVEFLLPYAALPVNGRNSHQRFEENMVTPARRVLNLQENRKLGYDSRVRHELLQSEVDWAVKRWGGGSVSKKLTHYAPTDITVNVLEKAC